ncbi:FtsX-like permease family protein [Portibacter marinus]|uniref:FtsX-like permease family protein n=1 Tax=Portibacter marinus TaxID=2898660 RepID=UPI001F231C07|nr:FtsX-like permease family protein [Portibacter marinus]
MNLSLDIARRYLFGKKSTNAINIISWISVTGVAIGTAALLLILSVFNGFEGLISGLFNAYNPDLIITPKEGKTFKDDPELLKKLTSIEGVDLVSKSVEEIVLFQYDETQEVGTLKGVDENFNKVTSIDSTLRKGVFVLESDDTNYVVAGVGIASKLGINTDEGFTPIIAYIPRLNANSPFARKYNSLPMYPAGTFSVQTEQDFENMITNLDFVQELREDKSSIGAYEVKLKPEFAEEEVRNMINNLMSDQFIIKNRFEQDEAFLKLMNIEKWVSYSLAGFAFVLIAFNLVGCLWMIVLDKKKDISILRSMGFTSRDVQWLFLLEGILICVLGVSIGLFLSYLFYILQINFGIISIPEGFIIDAYPIEMRALDTFIVILTVMGIGFLASMPAAFRAKTIKSFVREE